MFDSLNHKVKCFSAQSNMEKAQLFGLVDVLVFAAMLLLSFGIGVFFSIRDKRHSTTDNYYFGRRKLSAVPVSISLCVSLVSAVTVISFPMEAYKYGAVMVWLSLTSAISCFVSAIYFIPVLRQCECVSVYEILERRYNIGVKLFASGTQLIMTVVKTGVIIYLPSLALSAVSPLKISWVIAVTSVICTGYTALGGMKAVIWADVFQAVIMLVGTLSVLCKVSWEIRHEDVIQILTDSGRWNLFDFSFNSTTRLNFWNLNSMTVIMLFTFCCHQAFVQRHLSCKTTKQAQVSVLLSIIPQTILLVLSTVMGCAAFVYYKTCDPVKSNKIEKYDQTIPYLALESFSTAPGMAGLFVSAAYSGSLSTMSSGVSAMSIIVVEDFLKPILSKRKTRLSYLAIGRITTFTLGMIVMVIAYSSVAMGSAVLRFLLTVHGILSGAMFGAFVLALFLPWSNYKGAILGQVLGVGFAIFLTIGSIVYSDEIETNKMIPLLPQSCGTNYTELGLGVNSTNTPSYLVLHWFSLSHYLYGPIVLAITVAGGLFISFITGYEDPRKADALLFVPLVDNKRLPDYVRKFFRFGVPEISHGQVEEEIVPIKD